MTNITYGGDILLFCDKYHTMSIEKQLIFLIQLTDKQTDRLNQQNTFSSFRYHGLGKGRTVMLL